MSVEQGELNGTLAFSTIRVVDYKPVFLGDEQLKDLSAESIVFDPTETAVAAKEDHHEVSQFSPEFS